MQNAVVRLFLLPFNGLEPRTSFLIDRTCLVAIQECLSCVRMLVYACRLQCSYACYTEVTLALTCLDVLGSPHVPQTCILMTSLLRVLLILDIDSA